MSNCPRCDLAMVPEEYESIGTLFCQQCWGHWMTKEAFTEILQSERYAFSDEEKDSVLRQWAREVKESLEPVVKCPECDQLTERKAFSDDCPVMLDLCHDHGVWLDASEIKQVQIYFDSLK